MKLYEAENSFSDEEADFDQFLVENESENLQQLDTQIQKSYSKSLNHKEMHKQTSDYGERVQYSFFKEDGT